MRRPVRWGGVTQRTQVLSSVLIFMLLANVEGAAAAEAAQGDDSKCLKGFVNSASAQNSSNISAVFTWTAAALESPCNHTSALQGITCNNSSRVAWILLPSSNLAGTIPSSLSSCYFLSKLDLSSNSLSGSLPSALGELSYLSVLSLSNNNLHGPIPAELATLGSLTSLDLSRNQLTGSVPAQLGLLDYLRFFNVSYNNFSGLIPSTLSNTSTGSPRFNASCFAHNPNLFGYPLSPSPPFPDYLPSPSSNKKSFPTVFVVCIGLACGLGSFFLTCCLACLWLQWRKRAERTQGREQCTMDGRAFIRSLFTREKGSSSRDSGDGFSSTIRK